MRSRNLFATAATLALVAVLSPLTAHAAQDPTIDLDLPENVPSYFVPGTEGFSVTPVVGNTGTTDLTDATLTVTTSGRLGGDDVTLLFEGDPALCENDRTTTVCDVTIPAGETLSLDALLWVQPEWRANGYTTYFDAELTDADGNTLASVEDQTHVVAWEVPQTRWPVEYTDVEPGTVTDYTPVFGNDTDSTVGGVSLRFLGGYAVTFLDEYENCVSDGTHGGMVECVVPGFTPEPDTAYTVDADTPVRFEVDEAAPGPFQVCRCSIGVGLLGEHAARQYLAELGGSESGDQLGLSAAPWPGEDPVDGESALRVHTTDNPVDLAVTGAEIEGTVGETVPMTVSVVDNGPAWVGQNQDEGDVWRLIVEPPTGVDLDTASSACVPITDTDWPDPGEHRPGTWVCVQSYVYPDAGPYEFEFTATVTDDAPAIDGAVTALFHPDHAALDPYPDDNVAEIVLNRR